MPLTTELQARLMKRGIMIVARHAHLICSLTTGSESAEDKAGSQKESSCPNKWKNIPLIEAVRVKIITFVRKFRVYSMHMPMVSRNFKSCEQDFWV